MATIEEIDDLNDASVEIINGVNSEEEATKETQSSPTRAETVEEIVPVPTTAVVPSRQEAEDSDEEDEDIDETILERIVALHEMFPDCVQNATSKLIYGSFSTVKNLYSFARSASWIFFSTSAILFAPIIFEVERAQMEEMQKQQQRQILLGPGAAMGGGAPGMVPGMAPPPPR